MRQELFVGGAIGCMMVYAALKKKTLEIRPPRRCAVCGQPLRGYRLCGCARP